jgi:hypothetical protein
LQGEQSSCVKLLKTTSNDLTILLDMQRFNLLHIKTNELSNRNPVEGK